MQSSSSVNKNVFIVIIINIFFFFKSYVHVNENTAMTILDGVDAGS